MVKIENNQNLNSSYSSNSDSYASCHFSSKDPYAIHLYQNAQCTYASHAAISCYFYCKALDITDRYGVWECILYLMNMFHNHGVDHLNIANILLLSYYFQIKRIEKKEDINTLYNLSSREIHQTQQWEPTKINEQDLNLHVQDINKNITENQNVKNDFQIKTNKDNTNLTESKQQDFKQYSNFTIWYKLFYDPTLPKILWKSFLHSTFHFLSIGKRFTKVSLNHEKLQLNENKKSTDMHSYRSWVPLRSLDDSRLTRTLFVSCWLAFTWIEDIKIPLTRWCDLLRIVPLSEEEQSYINQIGFQQTFVDEVVTFWEDLGCFLHVSQNELDNAYLKMLGLETASYPLTPYLNYKVL